MKAHIDPKKFKRIMFSNTFLPLGMVIFLSIVFVILIAQLVYISERLNHSDRVIGSAHEILHLISDAETGQRGYVITSKESFLEPYHKSNKNFYDKIKELKLLVSDNSLQVARLNKVNRLRKDWQLHAEELMANRDNKERAKLIVSSENGKKIIDEIRLTLNDFISTEKTLRTDRNQSSKISMQLTILIVISLCLLVGIILALYSRRQINVISNTYDKALKKQTEQAWFKSAQAQISEKLLGDIDLHEVCKISLNFLCSYLDAKVGSVYILNSGELELCSSYGLLPDETIPSRLKIGTSLTGQVALENKTITLNPAPKDYLKINSSLGEMSSTSVIICPLTANNKVKGVIELGFFKSFNEKDLELLELLSESIGVAMTSAEYRMRLQELLEKSQRQAEELQIQQEELRVNNEELEEQSNALKSSQVQLETQQTELEQTNVILSQQAQDLEKQNEELGQTKSFLEIKAQELQKASEYKSQFLANMSHELRTPLNSTLILSQLLIDNKFGRLSKDEIEYAQTILSSSNDLLKLINDILDLSKVEAGKIDLIVEDVNLNHVLKSLESIFAPIALTKGIKFTTELQANTPEMLKTDKVRLEQILRNMLSNALKFTLKGSVSLTISTGKFGRIDFTVKDTGVGIPKDKQKLIFEAFQQGDGTTNRKFGGTGLGLTISRDLAKLLEGELSVESVPDKGSSFTLSISSLDKKSEKISKFLFEDENTDTKNEYPSPTRIIPRTNLKPSHTNDDRNKLDSSLKLLMVVEDDKDFAQAVYNLSREMNFQCILAETAEEAIQLANDYLPNAIILDMLLPDHSGLFVLDRLKENAATRHIPVHIISSQDFSSTALQMGAIGYLVKPAEKEKLINVIRKLEEKLTQDFKKVLIVEDNTVQRESMKKLISDESVEVTAVSTGEEAINLLQTTSFDCFILDISLPDMSGYEILERMSHSESLSHPPVIVYTGRDLTRDEEEKLQRFSRTIILKGAKSPERLVSEVGLFLHQVESKMPADRQKVLKDLRNREQDLEDKLLLLVDDDVRNIFALKNALEQRGAKIEIARNGLEAISKIESNPKIELVLMDIMMPEMNGYEAIQEIRKNPKFKTLPIIAVTAKAMQDDQEKCLAAGANDYLSKPVDLPKLLSLIRVWLHPSRRVTDVK